MLSWRLTVSILLWVESPQNIGVAKKNSKNCDGVSIEIMVILYDKTIDDQPATEYHPNSFFALRNESGYSAVW